MERRDDSYDPGYWGKPGHQLPWRRSQSTGHFLDEIFASRTHVRVLRTMIADVFHKNRTGRALAQAAEISRTRVAEVLQHLTLLEVVVEHRFRGYCIYELNKEHPLAQDLRNLFEEERLVALGRPRSVRERGPSPPRRT